MKNSTIHNIKKTLFVAFIIASYIYINSGCSTTRSLAEGEYRLASNKIEVQEENAELDTRGLSPYIKQHANSYVLFNWNPFLNIYNWAKPGENRFSDRFFRKIGIAPVIYDSVQTKISTENIEGHLEHLGWYGSKVIAKEQASGKKMHVTYKIKPGKQYTIDKIIYDVPENGDFAKDFNRDTVNVCIKPGAPLSEKTLEEESIRGATYFRNNGYFGFSKNYYFFEADTLTKPGSAILKYAIKEYTRNENPESAIKHRKYYIDSVTISHDSNLHFSERVLRNLNTVFPEQLYNEKNIGVTYHRLSNLKTFSGVNIEMTQTDTNKVDCAINLTPSPIHAFKINLEGSSNSSGLIGISPKLNYFNRNIFRGGEWLNLGFMGNFQFKPHSDTKSTEFGVSMGLSFPKFLGLPYRCFKRRIIPRTEINASYSFQDRPEYTRNIISTSFGYTGAIKNKFFYNLYPIRLNAVRLFNLDKNFYDNLANDRFLKNAYQNHFDVGMGLALNFTTNASVNPKDSYHYWRLQIDGSGNILHSFNSALKKDNEGRAMIWNTPYSQYVRTELAIGRTIVFGQHDNQAFAGRISAGIGHAYGNSSALPFEKQFYSGGANSLRGWQARAVGPGNAKRDTTFRIPSQTGDLKLEANIEYRFKMFWKLQGALFMDAGNVWTLRDKGKPVNDTQFNFKKLGKSIAIDWGIGLRVDLNFILLRLDYGVRLHDPALDSGRWRSLSNWKHNGGCMHFGVGYPF